MTAESKVGSPLGGSVSRTSRLRELLGAATPGPWKWGRDETIRGKGNNAIIYPYPSVGRTIHDLVNREEDAALIPAAVNALRPLLDVAEAAERLDTAPPEGVRHKYVLMQRRGVVHDVDDCDLCALERALAALDNRKDKP